jgi:hypothetical protein
VFHYKESFIGLRGKRNLVQVSRFIFHVIMSPMRLVVASLVNVLPQSRRGLTFDGLLVGA